MNFRNRSSSSPRSFRARPVRTVRSRAAPVPDEENLTDTVDIQERPASKRPSADKSGALKDADYARKLSTEEDMKEFLWQFKLAMGDQGVACLNFGVSRQSLIAKRRSNRWFSEQYNRILYDCKRVLSRPEEKMRESVVRKWFAQIMGGNSPKDMEAFMAYFNNKDRISNGDEVNVNVRPTETLIQAMPPKEES